jgi:hypothetical protein
VSDAHLSAAARALRFGAPAEAFLTGLDDETAWALMIEILAARPELLKRMCVRLNEGLSRARAQRGAAEAPGYQERRERRRADGLARAGSCLDLERWGGPWADPCTCCQSWGRSAIEGYPCNCVLCGDVHDHLASCQRCPGDPCSGLMAERLGLVAPRAGARA